MAGHWGSCDLKGLEAFSKALETAMKPQKREAFIKSCAKELAAKLLRMAKNNTPVGDYPSSSGKVGGTLKRGWTAQTHQEAETGGGDGKDTAAYANSLPVVVTGNTYTITVTNPVNYAAYVEFGHRKKGGSGWIEGRFMLTKSELELERTAPGILQKKLERYLAGCFKDG